MRRADGEERRRTCVEATKGKERKGREDKRRGKEEEEEEEKRKQRQGERKRTCPRVRARSQLRSGGPAQRH